MGLFKKKVAGSYDFMQNMNSAKKEIQSQVETNKNNFEHSFQEAINLLGQFSTTNNSFMLKQSVEAFLNLIELKPSRVEPYVYFAYVLYLYDKKDEAKRFIKLSESIDPTYSYIKIVKSTIYS
ncbi:MAG: hypothetical protein U0354_02760 [Candidatus Sericytochromatia bacterium]